MTIRRTAGGVAESARSDGRRVTFAKLNTLDLNSDPDVVVDVSFDGIKDVLYGSRAYWEARPDFVPSEGQLIVWTDHGSVTDSEGTVTKVPGFKFGDGNAYNLDLPFVGDDVAMRMEDALREHAEDMEIHVSSDDRIKWDGKLDVDDNVQNETLRFTK